MALERAEGYAPEPLDLGSNMVGYDAAVTQGRQRTPPGDPLVSIVTPVLNRADSIGDVLASVAAQTYGSIEHIVVDGGSNDGTVDIVESFSRSSRFPIRWISESDAGMYDAINKGLRMAKGDVLAYINSDDLYFPWSVETAVGALQTGCDLVFGDVAVIDKREERTRGRIHLYRPFETRYYALHARLAQATVFWTHTTMDTVGPFNRELRYLGDVEYWGRAGLAGLRFCHLDEVVALVVEHPGTLSVRHADAVRVELASIQKAVSKRLGEPKHEKFHRKAEALRWRWRQRGFRSQARRQFPTKWPRFLGLLRELQVDIGGNGLLVLILPATIIGRWPHLRRWIDAPDDFEQRFLATIRRRADVGGPGGSPTS